MATSKIVPWVIGAAVAWWLLKPKASSKKQSVNLPSSALTKDWSKPKWDGRAGAFQLYVDEETDLLRWRKNGTPVDRPPSETIGFTAQQWAAYEAQLIADTKAILVALRLRPRPPGADPAFADGFSNARLGVPHCPPVHEMPCGVVDEYGRLWPGKYGGGSTFTEGIVFIIRTAAPLVAIAYPPAAPMIYAGLAAYDARGKDISLKSVAVSAARSQVPPQYQFAFDVGVGVAAGKDPDQAVVDAYLEQNPEAKPYFDAGKKAAGK